MRGRPARAAVVLVLLMPAVLAVPAGAGDEERGPGRYAYLFLQGSLSDPSSGEPLAGATIRLTDGDRSFESVTDRRGAFVFERLPFARFRAEVTTADGRRVRGMRELEGEAAGRTRLEVVFGRGAAAPEGRAGEQTVRVAAGEASVDLVVAGLPPNKARFWKQFLIFLGAAAILAL